MINAKDVKKLREETSAPMMKAKEALTAADGDFDKAKEILHKKGEDVVGKKSKRKANEGVIGFYVHSNGKVAALVKLTCETDFVAKNEDFKKLAHDIAMQVVAMNPKYLSVKDASQKDAKKEKKVLEEKSLLTQPFIKDDKKTIADLITDSVSQFGENIKVEEFIRFEL